jgi:hypothetical protein
MLSRHIRCHRCAPVAMATGMRWSAANFLIVAGSVCECLRTSQVEWRTRRDFPTWRMAPAGRRRVSNLSGCQQRLCLPPLADLVPIDPVIQKRMSAKPFCRLGDCRRPCPLIGVLHQSSDIDLVGDLNGVIDLDAEAGNGAFDFRMPGRHRPWRVRRRGRSPEVHGQHRRRPFYETTPWVGGLGEDPPILAGTFILGIAVAATLLGAAAPPSCRLRHRSQRPALSLREHCSLVQGGLAE